MSSDNKDESNSPPPCVTDEENSIKDEDSQPMDESSMDSDCKDNEKDGVKKESDKESEKDGSEKDESDKEESVKEESGREGSEKDDNEKDGSEKESDREESEKEDNLYTKDTEVGLLDRPVEVTGCRERKKVERLEVSFSTTKEKQEIPEGRGQKLGECPRIEFQISKHPVTDLKILHRILFSRPGTVHETKKNIRKFSGFPFEKVSHEFEQKKVHLEKFKMSDLKKVCEVLDLERAGTKEDIILRVLDFLLSPKDSGKALLKKKSSGREKKKSAGRKPKDNKKKSKAKTASSDDDDDEIAPSASEHSDDNAEEDEEESDYDAKKKSKNAKGKKSPSKAKAVKKEKPKKESAAKGTKRKRDIPSDSSDDDEPVAKKSKMPSDEEIKKLVKRILDKADLQEITMKKVIKQVFDNYPECDLTHKKAFIKMTIKSVIS